MVPVQGTVPMVRGQMVFGPPGYEATQVPASQPSGDQQSWRAEKKAELGRGVNMPAMIINLDSSKHNYSSARFDNQPYWRFVGTCQGWLARIGLDRIEATVVREAELAGELDEPPEDVVISWGWIKPAHVDPTKESSAERGWMENQTLPWSDAVVAHGDDPDRVKAQVEKDLVWFKSVGLPYPAIQPYAPGQAGGQEAPDDQAGAEQPANKKPPVNGNGNGNGHPTVRSLLGRF